MLRGGGSVFNDLWGWWRADTYTGSNPNIVLTDKSGNGRDMTQQAGTLTPGTAGNGQAKMTGNSTARLTSGSTLKKWPLTMVVVGKRTAGALCGFFGHQGATPYNTLWAGYESLNRFYVINSNGTNNTTSEGGADACYIARIGWGPRVSIVNGILQSDMILSNLTRGSAAAVSLGTEYRGLNFDFYECLIWDRALTIAEIDEVHRYVNTRYSMSIPLWSSYSSVKAVCIHGDSNASGRAVSGTAYANVPAEYTGAQSNVNIWYGSPSAGIGTDFQGFNLTNNAHQLGDQFQGLDTYFGINTSIGKEYVDLTSNPIYINQFATGSTYLNYDASGAYLDPLNEAQAHNYSNRKFGLLCHNWWKALRIHQQNSRIPDPQMLLIVGVQDSLNESYTNNYSANMQALVPVLRSEMGFSTLKIFLARAHEDLPVGVSPYLSTLRTQQQDAVNVISNMVLYSLDTYTLDGTYHLDGTSNIAIGTELASLL